MKKLIATLVLAGLSASCAPSLTSDSKSVLPDGTVTRTHLVQSGGVDSAALGTGLAGGLAIVRATK